MKLKRQSRFQHEVSTGALNDIMFFLLLFFLIVATVANPQVIKLSLPKAGESEKVTTKPVNLTVSKDKLYFVGNDKAPVDWENVEGALRAAIAGIPDPTVVLRADKELDVQSLVDVMELGMRLQVRMVLQTSAN
jgi:biopolymer transport protein ExbD